MAISPHIIDTYPVRRVPITRPFVWLSDGWQDLMHHRGASLAYGWLVSALGALILAYNRHPLFLGATIVGFLVTGPILTAGLCELSRRREQGEQADFQSSLQSMQGNRAHLLAFAGNLAMVAAVWFAISGVVFFGLTGSVFPSLGSTVGGDVMRLLTDTQLIAYGAIGLLLAAAVFCASVVSVPMIIDRHVDANTALRTSLRVTVRDLPAMIVWAALIAGLVFVGFATALLGMVVIFPLLGHATWRAYRELVE
jgi:uncharacterized membrane protein